MDEIADLLVRYATAIDQRDWPLFRRCFTDDVTADYGALGTYTDAPALTGDEENWIEAVGHYDDELVHGDAGWRIRRRVSHTARLTTGGELAAALTGAR